MHELYYFAIYTVASNRKDKKTKKKLIIPDNSERNINRKRI